MNIKSPIFAFSAIPSLLILIMATDHQPLHAQVAGQDSAIEAVAAEAEAGMGSVQASRVRWGMAEAWEARTMEVGFDLRAGFPQGGFRYNVDQTGFGMGFSGLYHHRGGPIGVGMELGFLVYGSETVRETLGPAEPDLTVDVRRTNNLAHLLLVGRFRPLEQRLSPYLDLYYGMNYMFTDSWIVDDWYREHVHPTTEFDDLASTGGLGIGVRYEWMQGADGMYRSPFRVLLNAQLRYMLGSEADYLVRGSLDRVEDELVYETDRSRTDLLSLHLGISFAF